MPRSSIRRRSTASGIAFSAYSGRIAVSARHSGVSCGRPLTAAHSGAVAASSAVNTAVPSSVVQNAASRCRSVMSSCWMTAMVGPCWSSTWPRFTQTMAIHSRPNSSGPSRAASTKVVSAVMAYRPVLTTYDHSRAGRSRVPRGTVVPASGAAVATSAAGRLVDATQPRRPPVRRDGARAEPAVPAGAHHAVEHHAVGQPDHPAGGLVDDAVDVARDPGAGPAVGQHLAVKPEPAVGVARAERRHDLVLAPDL